MLRLFVFLWVLPNSLLGIAVGCLGLITGGGVQFRRGCIEFYGGMIKWFLSRLSSTGIAAMTLGHTIIGQTPAGLKAVRDHEHVHVKQYEKWGPLFVPAYLGCSVVLWLQRKDCYLDNPFEIEAYAKADPGKECSIGDSGCDH